MAWMTQNKNERKNQMNHVFSLAPSANIPRSVFKRPFELKTAINPDYLYPIYCDEVLPGDTFKMKFRLFGRLSTPLVPIMSNLYLDTFFFFVPNRLIDKDWKKFMGERPFGDLATPVTAPVLNSGVSGVAAESLSDYLGIPVGVANLDFSPYWHRAYNLIWNEWFRPEYICPAVSVAGVAEDGTVSTEQLSDYVLLKRGKRLDYFTGALPFPQAGSAVTLPLGNSAPVVGDGNVLGLTNGTYDYRLAQTSGATYANTLDLGSTRTVGVTTPTTTTGLTLNAGLGVSADSSKSGLVADLSNAAAATVNAFRMVVATQHFLEQLSRSGSRYIEIIRGMFGVISPDARMQRPEYLGGSSRSLDFTSVAQTSATGSSGTPQGNLAAFGTVADEGYWSKSFTEHGVILGLANIRADLAYQQGLPRMFSRSTRLDYYWPQFANVGEQIVRNKELFAQGASVVDSDGLVVDEQPFGYQEAWSEYKYHPHMITGKMRSTHSTPLDYWHLAQEFASLPTLSSTFVLESVPIDRCLAISTAEEPAFILAGAFSVEAARPMPLYSIPGLQRL